MKECQDFFLLVIEIYSLYMDLTDFVVIAMFYKIKNSDISLEIPHFLTYFQYSLLIQHLNL